MLAHLSFLGHGPQHETLIGTLLHCVVNSPKQVGERAIVHSEMIFLSA